MINDKSGKRSMVFRHEEAWEASREYFLPCGGCIPCRLKKSRDWGFRMMCESFDFDNSENCSFLTLTYNNDSIGCGSLVLKEMQDFMKRLRVKLARKFSKTIRVFYCGEYGGKTFRKHWHLIIFGHNFPDKVYFNTLPNGTKLYRSDLLEDCWKYGYSTVCDVCFESCAYVARYCTKKIRGSSADDHYLRPDMSTGEIIRYKPEFHNMSRDGGIGLWWLMRNYSEVYPKDFMTFGDGKKWLPPKAFDDKFKIWHPYVFDEIKAKRLENFAARKEQDSFEREQISRYWEQTLGLLVRPLE